MARARVFSAVVALALVGNFLPTAHAADPPDLFLEHLLQYTWTGGTGTKTWQSGSNWSGPTFPGSYPYVMPAYPNEPNRIIDPSETMIWPVLGANLSVPLASNLTVQLIDLAPTTTNDGEDDVFIASLKLGSTTAPVKTTVGSATPNNPGGEPPTRKELLIFQNFEINDDETNPGDDMAEPEVFPEVLYSFNKGRALIWSTGVAGVTNEITSDVRFDDDTIVEGDRDLTIWGDIYEGPIDRDPNDGIIQGGGNEGDPAAQSSSISSLLSNGATLHIRGNIYSTDEDSNLATPLTVEDRGFFINTDRGIRVPPNPQDPDAPKEVLRQGNVDIHGKIIGEGDIFIGSSQGSLNPLPTIFLRGDNKEFTGRFFHNRSNLVLAHDNALGAPTNQLQDVDPEMDPGGEMEYNKGDYKSSNPNQGFGFDFISDNDSRVIATDMNISQWQTIKGATKVKGLESIGDHSLRIAGEISQENTRGFINLLPYNYSNPADPNNKTLTISGPQYPLDADDEDLYRIYTLDGSGFTHVTGGIGNRPLDTELAFGNGHFRKRGTGTVLIDFEENDMYNGKNLNVIDFNDGNGPQPVDVATNYSGYTWVQGGVLRFHDNDDLPNPDAEGEVISTNGAITVDSGVIGNTTFLNMLNNKANPNHNPVGDGLFDQLDGPRAIYNNYDHGGLALAVGEYGTNVSFAPGGNLENAANMSLAARETGSSYTGTITPASDNVYRLGGGGKLTLPNANQLTGSRSVLITNSSEVQTGTNNYTGKTTILGKSSPSGTDLANSGGEDAAAGDNIGDEANFGESIRNSTLTVTNLGNGGASSGVGASTNAADNLMIQAGTLKYAGAATSTDRLFTVGTRGGTIDASGTGAVNFSNTGALAIDIAEDRPAYINTSVPGNRNDEIFGIPQTVNGTFGIIEFDTSDLVPGMTIVDVPGPPGTTGDVRLADDDSPIEITSIASPHVIRTGETDLDDDEDEDDPHDPWPGYSSGGARNIQFGPAPARFLTLTGSNTGNNTLTPVVHDAPDRDEVMTLTIGGVATPYTPGEAGGHGSVGIRKTGTGTWVLAGNNDYTGETQVQAGTLKVTGSTGTGDTIVSKGRHVDGDDIGGDLIIQTGGTVNPGMSPGKMTVGGDYSLGVGAKMVVEIAGTGASQYDQIEVQGADTAYNPGTYDTESDPAETLEGDYNENGIVDAVDYSVLRDAIQAGAMTIPNRGKDYTGPLGDGDFILWRNNFGNETEAEDYADARDAAILAGTIFIDLQSFSPSIGNMFTVLTTTTGTITNNGLTLSGDPGFNLIVNPTSVVLQYVGGAGSGYASAFVPEPSSLCLAAFGLLAFAGIRRRAVRS